MKKSLDFDLEVSLYQIATLALSSSSVVVRKYDTDKLTSKDTKPTNAIIFNGDKKENVKVHQYNNQTNKLTYKQEYTQGYLKMHMDVCVTLKQGDCIRGVVLSCCIDADADAEQKFDTFEDPI